MKLWASEIREVEVEVSPKECVEALCEFYFKDFNCWSLSNGNVIKQVDESYHGSPYYVTKAEVSDEKMIEIYKHLKELKKLV